MQGLPFDVRLWCRFKNGLEFEASVFILTSDRLLGKVGWLYFRHSEKKDLLVDLPLKISNLAYSQVKSTCQMSNLVFQIRQMRYADLIANSEKPLLVIK